MHFSLINDKALKQLSLQKFNSTTNFFDSIKFIQRDPLFGDIVVLKAYVVGVLPLTTKKRPQSICARVRRKIEKLGFPLSTCKEGFNL